MRQIWLLTIQSLTMASRCAETMLNLCRRHSGRRTTMWMTDLSLESILGTRLTRWLLPATVSVRAAPRLEVSFMSRFVKGSSAQFVSCR